MNITAPHLEHITSSSYNSRIRSIALLFARSDIRFELLSVSGSLQAVKRKPVISNKVLDNTENLRISVLSE